ncbi:MAG: SPOR domain-containing protein, partial [candidate division WOR-3 bacterium]
LPQSMTPSGENHYVLLITDTERESIFKIFDLQNGRLIKKMVVPKVLVLAPNPVDNTLASLDINNNLIVYDVQLNKKKVIHPDIESNSFTHCGDGYLMSNREGIFLLNSNGKVIDFQPLALDEHWCTDKYLFVVKNGIVHVDSLTLRIKKRNQINKKLIKLFHVDFMNNVIALDNDDNFYVLEDGFSWLRPMEKREAVLKEIEVPVSSVDSLWYFQVGAFVNQQHAIALYDSLRQSNIPVFIDSSDLYRVKFGGFKDKMNAMNLITEIRLHGWFVFQQKMRLGKREEFYVGAQKYILEEGIIQKE